MPVPACIFWGKQACSTSLSRFSRGVSQTFSRHVQLCQAAAHEYGMGFRTAFPACTAWQVQAATCPLCVPSGADATGVMAHCYSSVRNILSKV